MAEIFPYALNFIAIMIAVFGVYRSAIRDFEMEKDRRKEVEQENNFLKLENNRLREIIASQKNSGVSIHDSNVEVRDIVSGDSNKQNDIKHGN